MFVLNMLCVTICDVISCCFETTMRVKLTYSIKSWLKKQKKKRKYYVQRNSYTNLHLKDDLEMKFTAC